MYAIPNASRVHITSFLLLCAAFFLAPKVNAAVYTMDDAWHDFNTLKRDVDQAYERMTKRPSNSTLVKSSSPITVTKNAAGGLSASTNQILKTLDQPSNFSVTSNYSAASAKTALKSCVRSVSCAGRALGVGTVLYEGVKAWQDVYNLLQDPETNQIESFHPDIAQKIVEPYSGPEPITTAPALLHEWPRHVEPDICTTYTSSRNQPMSCWTSGGHIYMYTCTINRFSGLNIVGFFASTCQYAADDPFSYKIIPQPVSYDELDQMIDDAYEPQPSDAPLVLTGGGLPETISLTTPEPANLPATTSTSTDSQGKTTTTVKNSVITYNILNNNSSSPSIESTITETSNTYDDTANLVGSMTSTTTNNPVAPDPLPPSSGASADIELPPFCTYASIVCDWIGWTKEGIEGEEPDLINLISEFEPDENQYNSGIGSGSCPAPMSLNLGIINRTVDVSYQPFCDFLDMIRPLVIAGAWLLSAFMYVGVLRRG